MALDVLADKPQGADTLEIIKLINAKFKIEVPRTSMSPQLSRLKADRKLVMEDKIWRLPQYGGQKDETPPGRNPESVSKESRDDPTDIFD